MQFTPARGVFVPNLSEQGLGITELVVIYTLVDRTCSIKARFAKGMAANPFLEPESSQSKEGENAAFH